MLVAVGVSWDLNWFLQLLLSVIVVAVGLHFFVKSTASRYFEVDANFEGDHHHHHHHHHHALADAMPGVLAADAGDSLCAVCATRASKKCSRCKAVRYCSQACQQSHWKSGHKTVCKDFHDASVRSVAQNGVTNRGFKASAAGGKSSPSIALIPGCGAISRPIKQAKDVLFPYDEFVKFFNWDKPGFTPCGLLNCGNSCFANVVLQCLSFTRPLVAYLLEKSHRRECSYNDWCFLCEFENHVERTRQGSQAFSPMNILSRLPNIGGTLGYGRQEDAHEFMRFSIDTMQSVCLDEFGGEKAVPPNLQETTLIQHIFGGRLQSEVICTKCDKISNQYENMMDLTVEIHGDAASLEECLDQFTAREWLDGENMYKCEGCKDYVKAWKRLTVKCAPNILTIALKRFQV
ncbi:Ubiquitin carboxyl-terminal hydrolase 19 [Spatholobus suberectus]|nr:Ubiquitin carboxyl-terminal hydrolase 19 [Spatholobus suberectus]